MIPAFEHQNGPAHHWAGLVLGYLIAALVAVLLVGCQNGSGSGTGFLPETGTSPNWDALLAPAGCQSRATEWRCTSEEPTPGDYALDLDRYWQDR